MINVCIVTDELHPFNGGGIGRMVSNFIDGYPWSETRLFLLVKKGVIPSGAEFANRFKRNIAYAEFDFANHPRRAWRHNEAMVAPFLDQDSSPFHSQSTAIMFALRRFQEAVGVEFDYIEFPDFRGWAHATEQEKLCQLGFAKATIVVRLHGTCGILDYYEPGHHDLSNYLIHLYDIERAALLNADLVVGHLPATVAFYQRFYAFPEAWQKRTVVNMPPIRLDGPTQAPPTGGRKTDGGEGFLALFSTRIQAIKQPELFVRAAATLLYRHRRKDIVARLACGGWYPEFTDQVRQMIPADLRDRLTLNEPPSSAERDRLIAHSAFVVCSRFEALCLAAYEASLLGAITILNEACPAFGADSPWRDGENCLKFDGTASGLVAALEHALVRPHLAPVQTPVDPPYWATHSPLAKARRPERPPWAPLVSVVITNRNLGIFLRDAIESVRAMDYPAWELLVVDDGSTRQLDLTLLDELERSGVRVIRNPYSLGLAAARNIGVRAAAGELIVPLDADDILAPWFVRRAVAAMRAEPSLAVVVPQIAYVKPGDVISARTVFDDLPRTASGFQVFLPDCHGFSLIKNCLAGSTALIRAEALRRHPYDESFALYEDWELYNRMRIEGLRFAALNYIGVAVRIRDDSMLGQARTEASKSYYQAAVLDRAVHLAHGYRPPMILRPLI